MSWQVILLVLFSTLMILYRRYRIALMIAFAGAYFALDSPWAQMHRNLRACAHEESEGHRVMIDGSNTLICDQHLQNCRKCKEAEQP
jgi:hypothetical protein